MGLAETYSTLTRFPVPRAESPYPVPATRISRSPLPPDLSAQPKIDEAGPGNRGFEDVFMHGEGAGQALGQVARFHSRRLGPHQARHCWKPRRGAGRAGVRTENAAPFATEARPASFSAAARVSSISSLMSSNTFISAFGDVAVWPAARTCATKETISSAYSRPRA